MEADKLMEKNFIVVFLFLKSITISIHFNNYALQNKHLLHRLQRKKLIYMFSFNRVSIDKKKFRNKKIKLLHSLSKSKSIFLLINKK